MKLIEISFPPSPEMPAERVEEPVQGELVQPPAERVEEPVQEELVQPPAERVEEPVQEELVQPPAERVEEPVQEELVQPPAERVEEPVQEELVQPPAERVEEPVQEELVQRPAERVEEPVQDLVQQPPVPGRPLIFHLRPRLRRPRIPPLGFVHNPIIRPEHLGELPPGIHAEEIVHIPNGIIPQDRPLNLSMEAFLVPARRRVLRRLRRNNIAECRMRIDLMFFVMAICLAFGIFAFGIHLTENYRILKLHARLLLEMNDQLSGLNFNNQTLV